MCRPPGTKLASIIVMANTPAKPAQRWHSWLARARQKPLVLALVYACIIMYASLYSASAWQDRGLDLLYFLEGSWPKYWTWQDAWFNVLAYMPLGFLLSLSPTHRPWPWARIFLPLLAGFLLSASLEALQTFIPGRVSSGLDLTLNTAGTLLGSTLALMFGPRLLALAGDVRRKLAVQRLSAEAGLILLWLWLFAQISPETVFFGLGDLRGLLSLPTALAFSPALYSQLETAVVAMQTLVVTFLTQAVLQRVGLRWFSIFLAAITILLFGVLIRVVASWLLIGQAVGAPEIARWVAITPGGINGLLIGLALAIPALLLSGNWQLPIAAMLLMAATVLVNLMPTNPYSISALTVWQQGHFLNFNGLTRLIAALWPYLTLLFLVWTDRRRNNPAATSSAL
jgi:VanZ family protein